MKTNDVFKRSHMADTLRTLLDMQSDIMFSVEDLEYRLYLQDHKTEIIRQSQLVLIDANQMARYKYRPRFFLYDQGFPPASDWLFLWLNDMTGPMCFKDLKSVYVPNYSHIEQLFSTYRTLSSTMKRAGASLKKQLQSV